MPASRPRMVSGIVWFHTVPRNTAEIMSAAPESMRNSSTSQTDGIRPASPMQAPYAAAAITIARPWWCTLAVQPLNAAPEGADAAVADAIAGASADAFHLAMLVAAGLLFAGAAVSAAGLRSGPLRTADDDDAALAGGAAATPAQGAALG